jgi:hypothetical protein
VITTPHYPQQAFSPPPTPNIQNVQPPKPYTPPTYTTQQPNSNSRPQFAAPVQSYPSHPQQPNAFTQQPHQQQQQQQQQQQPNGYANQPHLQNQAKSSSMLGGSIMGGNVMTKVSSKFTQLQKSVPGAPTAANPNAKPTDWKKWAKRGAIGVAGIGALALGVDAAGDMFSGAEGLAGGGDFDFGGGGEDFSGFEGGGGGEDAAMAMDAQAAVDASAMESQIALMGQENSMMLLDPVGTTCKYLLYLLFTELLSLLREWFKFLVC